MLAWEQEVKTPNRNRPLGKCPINLIQEDNPFESPTTLNDRAIVEIDASPYVALVWILPLLSGLLFVTAFLVPPHIFDVPITILFFAASLLTLIAGIVVTIHAFFVRKQWSKAWPHLLAGMILNLVVFIPMAIFIYLLISLILFFSSFS